MFTTKTDKAVCLSLLIGLSAPVTISADFDWKSYLTPKNAAIGVAVVGTCALLPTFANWALDIAFPPLKPINTIILYDETIDVSEIGMMGQAEQVQAKIEWNANGIDGRLVTTAGTEIGRFKFSNAAANRMTFRHGLGKPFVSTLDINRSPLAKAIFAHKKPTAYAQHVAGRIDTNNRRISELQADNLALQYRLQK